MSKINTTIYAPWVIFFRKVEALFKKDPKVHVEYDKDAQAINIKVDDSEKADALQKKLPSTKVFGNVVLSINVIPANNNTWEDPKLFEIIFEGNEAFSHITTISDIPDADISNPIGYCTFKKEVAQYAADDLSSEYGVASTLYEDLAKDVFGDTNGVYFCTDVED